MQAADFLSIFDASSTPRSKAKSLLRAAFLYEFSHTSRLNHLLSLRRPFLRILQKPNLRQRREVLSLEFTLKCAQVFCDVCGESADVRDLVVCAACRTVVHRCCYGGLLLTKAAWSEWLCDSCFLCGLYEVSPAKVVCCLCDTRYGAIKYVRRLGWAHPGCVTYSDALEFADHTHDSVARLLESPPKSLCRYCSQLSQWTSSCAATDCTVTFHYRCAQSAGVRPLWRDSETHLYCKAHRVERAGVDADAKAVRRQFKFYRSLQPSFTVDVLPAPSMQLRSAKASISPPRVIEPPPVPKQKRRTDRPKLPVKRPKIPLPAPRHVRPREEQRILSTELSELTGIHNPGTIKELENKLKAFLRQNKKRDDYNFYDVSHIPELVKVLGYGGKVEHRLLPAVVLQHSFVVTV